MTERHSDRMTERQRDRKTEIHSDRKTERRKVKCVSKTLQPKNTSCVCSSCVKNTIVFIHSYFENLISGCQFRFGKSNQFKVVREWGIVLQNLT